MKNVQIRKQPLIVLLLFMSMLYSFGVCAQNVDLVIQKTGPNIKHIGEPMNYAISISNNGPSTAVNATFTDTFPANVSNVVFDDCVASGGATCPSTSDYSITSVVVGGEIRTVLNGIIPNLPFGGQIDMTVSLNAPSADVGGGASFSNTAYVYAPSSLIETAPITNQSTWNVTLLNDLDIEVISNHTPTGNLGDCSTFPKTLEYAVQWVNHGPSVADGIQLRDRLHFHKFSISSGTSSLWISYPWEITNVQWSASSPNSIAPSSLFDIMSNTDAPVGLDWLTTPRTENQPIVSEWAVGDTISLTYTLNIDAPNLTGCERTVSWEVLNEAKFEIPSNFNLQDTNSANDFSHAANATSCAAPLCPRVDIEVIKQNTPSGDIGDCSNLPATIDYVVQWVNHGPDSADGTRLSESMIFSKKNTIGIGAGRFNYPWEISNLQWAVSSPTTTLPTGTFPSLSGIEDSGGISNFNTTVNTWGLGDTITLTYSATISSPVITGCGLTVTTAVRNLATYYPPLGNPFIDPVPSNNTVIVENDIICTSSACPECDIEVVKSVESNFDDCSIYPKAISYTTQWINNGPSVAAASRIDEYLYFDHVAYIGTGNATYDFPWEIANMQWQVSSGNTATPTVLFNNTSGIFRPAPGNNNAVLSSAINNINNWASGDTITFTYDIIINEPVINGCGRNIDWKPRTSALYSVTNISYADPNSSNNSASIDHPISNYAIDLALSKNVSPVIIDYLDTLDLTLTFQNASGSSSIGDVYWLDTLPASLTLLPSTINCIGSGGIPCPTIQYDNTTREMRQDLNDFPAGGIVTITYRAIANTPYKVSENTRAWAVNPCADCDEGTNFTQTNFQIDGPLPVELVYFKVQYEDCNTTLKWSTASEENNDYFIVEKSNNGIDFSEVGRIDGAGTTIEIQTYLWVDKNISQINNYYRLKQVDFDGRFEYSDIVFVQLEKGCLDDVWIQALVYPNPTKDITTLDIELEDAIDNVQFRLVDVLGNEISQQWMNLESGQNKIVLDLQPYPKGTYFLQITSGSDVTKVLRIVTVR